MEHLTIGQSVRIWLANASQHQTSRAREDQFESVNTGCHLPALSSQQLTGITKSVNPVDAIRPKMSDHPSPEKIGSIVIGRLDKKAAPAVIRIGLYFPVKHTRQKK